MFRVFTCNMCSIDSNCVFNNPHQNNNNMKANELMIGDWVECTYWTPSKQLKVAEIRRIVDDEIKIREVVSEYAKASG